MPSLNSTYTLAPQHKNGDEQTLAMPNLIFLRSTTQLQLLREIDRLNEDSSVHGIIVQMPLDTDDTNMDSHLVGEEERMAGYAWDILASPL